ncbi:uncharacterized protein LOC143292836 [Babylonia areolata]|uniref:uncharacterized protein LOC143292836 n=1 Tax=Babylonia areolata TaxID=304850 RepID=UPI003FCF4F1E
MADDSTPTNCRPKRLASIRRFQSQAREKRETRKKLRQVSNILKKEEAERTEEEIYTLHQLPDIVKTAEKNAKRKLQQKERILEIEDEPDVLDQKCQELAQMLLSAKSAVVYTGAGISTAASIPDYRGPNGVWTLLRKGQSLRAQDLVDAEPTYTHMCITKLFKMGRVKYLVSQNCDGLHIRSGYPRTSMSEVHGNMFIEICKNCKPQKEYLRLFDVTERTAKGRHKTGRTCSKCGKELVDSIVHFGEKGGLKSPYRWKQAVRAASKSDLIICLGSSLKVLRRYPCLWRMDIRPEQRPKLVIVNLQWTPKDEQASLKIHGRCDDVLKRVAQHIGLTVPAYRREEDPLFRLQAPVQKGEEHFASKRSLETSSLTSNNQRKKPHKVPKNESAQPSGHQGKNRVANPDGQGHSFQAFKSINNFLDHVTKTEGSFSRAKLLYLPISDSDPAFQVGHMLNSESLSENKFIPLAETKNTGKKFFPHVVSESENGSSFSLAVDGENRHIPDPVRVKLEQMLMERGVIKSSANMTSIGRASLVQNTPSDSATTSVPSINSFLHHIEGHGAVQRQHSHPNLCHLLISDPIHPKLLSSLSSHKGDQEVFRVDLSTSPISISTTHCTPHAAPPLSMADTISTTQGPNAQNPPGASISDYAKLVHNVRFDHSYSRPAHKACPARKMQSNIRDSLPCSLNTRVLQQMQGGSLSSSPASVIASSSYDPWTINDSSSEQGGVHSSQKLQGDTNSNLALLDHHLPYAVNPAGSQLPEKVVVNLSPGVAFAFHCPALSRTPTMQQHQEIRVPSSEQPSVSSSGCDSSFASRTRDGEMSDEDSENYQTSGKRKRLVSVPGWFGKGLRVRRKRTA